MWHHTDQAPARTRNRRAVRVVAAAALLALALTACADSGGDDASAPLRVAFVFDGRIDDGGWNTAHEAGRQYVEETVDNIELTSVEEVAPGDAARAAIEDLATQGNELIVATSFYQDDVLAVAEDFPDTKFVTWGGWITADNVGHYSLATEEGRYLDGLVAGSVTESGQIGYPAGFPIENTVRAINAFARGVREVNPDAAVVPLWINSWYDPPMERQAAEALVDSGIDVLAHELNSPAVASVAQRRGVHHLGFGWDQSDRAPESWLSSFKFEWGPYYVAQVEAVRDGTWEPELYYGGVADGGITLSPFGPDVPEDVVALVEQRLAEIADGSFDVMAGPLVDNQGATVVGEGETVPFEERPSCCTWLLEGVKGSLDG